MEEDHSSAVVSRGSIIKSLSHYGSISREGHNGSSLLIGPSEESQHAGLASAHGHRYKKAGVDPAQTERYAGDLSHGPELVTLGQGSNMSDASLAGSLVAPEFAANRPSEDKISIVQSQTLDTELLGNEWDETGDKYLLSRRLLVEVDAQVAYGLLDEYNQQLEILGKIVAAPYVKEFDDEKETLRKRFRREEDEPLKLRSSRGDQIVPANPSLVKIQHERAYLGKVVSQLMKGLRRDSSHVTLEEAVDDESSRRQEFATIEEDAIINSQRTAKLRKEIRHHKTLMTAEIKERDEAILELSDELQEVLAKTGMEMRYTQATIWARLAASDGQLETRRLASRQEASQTRAHCDYETRVNTEIESQMRDALDELNEILDQRLTKFDVDTDAKERELSSLKYQKQQNYQALCDMKDKFAKCTRVIAEDDEEQRLEEARVQEEERRERAAITIQAYWKGYLERKKLKRMMRKAKKAAKKAKKDSKKKK